MDKIIESVLLGIIQGITEFLPISSSAHLRVFTWIFNWTEISESFDLALHFGTLIALCVYFFKDGIFMIRSGLALLYLKLSKNKNLKFKDKEEDVKKAGHLFWFIVLATIPAGILSLILDKVSDNIFGDSVMAEIICIAVVSCVMGILLYFVDKKLEAKKNSEDITLKDTMLIGVSQAFAAAFPGVSRSGVTITTSRLLKYDRESSAKLSFLLSIPIVLAAVLVKLKDFDFSYPIAFFLGIFVSFVVGLVAINFLMKYLKKGNYKVFAIYRVVFSIVLVISIIIKSMS